MLTETRYVDLQVNGYAGVDFNVDNLSAESLHECCARLQRDGVAGILATVITAPVDAMCARLARIVQHRDSDPLVRETIWGLHVEGPFINGRPGYVGAHPPAAVCPADPDTMKRLLDAADGLVRIVTLAPEQDEALPGVGIEPRERHAFLHPSLLLAEIGRGGGEFYRGRPPAGARNRPRETGCEESPSFACRIPDSDV